MSDLDKMWAALEAHKPKPKYAGAWRRMCAERTEEAAEAAAWAVGRGVAWQRGGAEAWNAAWAARDAVKASALADAARAAAWAAWAAEALERINKAEDKT